MRKRMPKRLFTTRKPSKTHKSVPDLLVYGLDSLGGGAWPIARPPSLQSRTRKHLA